MDKEKLYAWLKDHPRATFSEIERFFDENHYDWRGDYAVWNFPGSNVVFWAGWAKEAADMMTELTHEERVGIAPVPPIFTLFWPDCLDLPLAKRHDRRYKNLHWLPAVVKCIA